MPTLDKYPLICTIVQMYVVSDTNIFLAVALDEPEKAEIVRRTADVEAVSPEILPYEIGNALTAMIKRKQLTHDEALSTYKATSQIPVRLFPVDIQEALELAMAYDIYTYDAYFLQCAKALSCPLITLDTRMKQVANDLNIVDMLE